MKLPSLLRQLLSSVVTAGKQGHAERHAKKVIELCHALLSERGEVSGAVLARATLSAWQALPDAGLPVFFDLLEREFAPDPVDLVHACTAYCSQPSADNLLWLQHLVEAPRQELFRRLNMAAGGTATLIAMRHQLLARIRSHPGWKCVDADFSHLFSSWFNRGFLALVRIDWHTPAFILEKLIQYEAVHEISNWKELQRRLEADRRCFAFFHPSLQNEPLIFIEVALTRGMSDAVQPLLELDTPIVDLKKADTAIFYSITSCQEGLRGISFGNLLIKQVAEQLGREFPRIRTFATLSPVPGFRDWLKSVEKQLSTTAAGRAAIAELDHLDDANWSQQAGVSSRIRKILMPLCAYYLIHAKQNDEPLDAVARFHLSNGARLERLNWLADTSNRGMQRSAGLMVNYLYDLGNVEEHHEVYVKEHRVVVSNELRKLARACPLAETAIND